MRAANDRRAFIRVLGGSIVAAALPPFGRLLRPDYPSEAVAAWSGPDAGAELRRWALAFAILAPNSHNRQPWLADLREPGAIVLRVDRERLLPETDPWFRQIVVSQGTFLEALAIALRQRGVEPEITLFPEGEFPPRARSTTGRSPASPGVPTYRPGRQATRCSRSCCGATPPRSTMTPRVRWSRRRSRHCAVSSPTPPFASARRSSQCCATHCARSASSRRWSRSRTPRTMMESIRLIPPRPGRDRPSSRRHQRQHARAAPRRRRRRLRPQRAAGRRQRRATSRRWRASKGTAARRWASSGCRRRVGCVRRVRAAAEVRAGRAYMRLQLKATELGLQVHPMSQARAGVRRDEAALRPPALAPARQAGRGRGTVQMFCRVGYCRRTAAHAAARRRRDRSRLSGVDNAAMTTPAPAARAKKAAVRARRAATPAARRRAGADTATSAATPIGRDREATKARLLGAVGVVLARDGFGGDRRQRRRQGGRRRQGASSTATSAACPSCCASGARAAASGRASPSCSAADPKDFFALPAAERYARFFDHFIDALRARPLTARDPRRRDRRAQRARPPSSRASAKRWGEEASRLLADPRVCAPTRAAAG